MNRTVLSRSKGRPLLRGIDGVGSARYQAPC